MFLSAKYIDIKQNQDYASFVRNSNDMKLVLCDGIGSMSNSLEAAKRVVAHFEDRRLETEQLFINIASKYGGTTFIHAVGVALNEVEINYLGDGGIIHLPGDFAPNEEGVPFQRYVNLMLPDHDQQGRLLKYIAGEGDPSTRSLNRIQMNLNHTHGDILLFFTDGIDCFTQNPIVKDNNGRYWRYEERSVQIVLQQLHLFLSQNCTAEEEEIQNLLETFNIKVLKKLKEANLLEDDASLGILFTTRVIDYYKSNKNA